MLVAPRFLLLSSSLVALCACPSKGDTGSAPPPPPPPPSAAPAGACASGGGQVTDSVSASFFPRSAGGYCVDPHGETKTYGESAQHTKEEVCTTLFDGECEIYLRYKLARVVALRYVDGAGKGGSVEVHLSRFADPGNAYGMFTKRVIADSDPADESAPKPLQAGGAAVVGTGSAYVWKGPYVAELAYNNEQESPEQIAKSSGAVLPELAKEIGAKLPGPTDKPAAVKALPEANLVSNAAVQYVLTDALDIKGLGPAAIGYYKDGAKRWRAVAIATNDPEQAKDAFKMIASRPGSLPIPGIGDQAAHVVLSTGEARPKVEWLFARKGGLVAGVGDEEYALREGAGAQAQATGRLSKDDAVSKMKAWLAGAPVQPSAAPSGSAAAPKK